MNTTVKGQYIVIYQVENAASIVITKQTIHTKLLNKQSMNNLTYEHIWFCLKHYSTLRSTARIRICRYCKIN